MTNASQTRLAYVTESTWGTTPSTPAFQNLRFTGESLNPNIENTVSNEIRPDRNVTDLIQTGQSAGGSFAFELSYGSFDDILESLMQSAWSTNVIKNGSTEKYFTIEKTFEVGATDQYHRFAGAAANSLSLNMAVGSPATGSFDFMAKGMTSAQAAITGATYTAANTNPVINVATSFADLAMTGVTSPEFTNLSLSVTNNLRNQRVLGSLDARGIAAGRFNVTGSFTAYFENEEMLDLYLAGTATDLSFKLGGASSKNYVFDLPNIKLGTHEVVAGGNDQDVLANVNFTALYDSGESASLKITRTA